MSLCLRIKSIDFLGKPYSFFFLDTFSSDIALKSNIQPLTNVLDKINQITGYKYDFTS